MASEIHDLIRSHLATSVPFAAHTGVELVSVGDGTAVALLPQQPTSVNHIGSQHAGALFTVAEAASGAAMAGALADRILETRPLVRSATATYVKVARGTITAEATTVQDGATLRGALDRDGRTEAAVEVSMRDELGVEVARLHVDWVVSLPKQPTA
jgi:uncharacterized protein (TIGR00369 family)